DSELVFKGVVYNEMKGAMSSVTSQLWHTLCKYLYPSTTYHYNSGGSPEHIPDLTYEQLKHFYKTHYHPSNAIFMTYGDIPAATHQARFEAQALSRFERLDSVISVPAEKRYHSPIKVEEAYPLDESEGEDLSHKTHVVMAWLLGKTTNLAESLEAHLLSNVLLDNSASPLQQALETTDLGQAPSPLCGMDDSQHEIAFVCGLEGCALEDVDKIEQLILDTLRRVADEGVPQQLLEASLHQLELQQREVGGDGYPYGLQLIMTSLTAATHRGDPIALLDLDTALTDLRNKIQQPDFIQKLARKLLLDNPHQVRLTLRPNPEMNQRIKEAELARLADLKSQLSDADKQAIIERSHALQARQLRKDDESILPKVGLEDIPPQLHYIGGSHETFNGYPLRRYSAGTNGLVYQQITCKMPALDEELKSLLPLYCMAVTELGVGDKDYLATQRWQAKVVGSINAFSSVRGSGDDVQAIDAYLTLSAKALTRNSGAMSDLMHATLTHVRVHEVSRLPELIAQARARALQSVARNGHSLVMPAACAGTGAAARLTHELSGLAGIQALKTLDNSLDDERQLEAYASKLSRIHQLILEAPRQFLLVGEQEHLDDYLVDLQQRWPAHIPPADFKPFVLPPVNEQIQEAWLTNTQVNFCVKAYPTVPADHPDAAVLTVLGG